MGTAVTFGVAATLVLLTVLAVWLQQRSLAKDGGRRATAMGDGLGNVIDVFDPAQARASRDLKDQRNQGPVMPVPDPDPDDPIQLELGPDGMPAKARIKREPPV